MSDPRPPAGPPTTPETVTGEWSSADRPPPHAATLTSSGTGPTLGELGIPNPFGRYAITHLLGRGGMGAVFLAHDTQLERPVALKVPTFRGTLTATQKERFFREARSIAALRHPNICPVFDVDEEQGFLFLTMAYIDGQPLSALIARGPVPQERAVDLVRRVARAMQAAHAHGTIHRDLKPANVLVDKGGEPVVMDFGLARRVQWADDARDDGAAGPAGADPGLTQHGAVLGTPAYMPPEQARGDVGAIGPRSDVYSLGVILYELLTGRRPFRADDTAELIRQIEHDPPPPLREFYPWINPAVEAACLRALAKDPADRFATMAEFERALKQAVEPELKVVLPPPLPRPARPKPTRRWWVKPAGCLGLALLILTVCVGGPVASLWWLISGAFPKPGEWDLIANHWPAPAPDAQPETLLPPTFDDGRYSLRVSGPAPADADMGITLPGQRAVYDGPDGEVEVRFYRCPGPDAQKIQQRVVDVIQTRGAGKTPADPKEARITSSITAQDARRRTVSYEVHDRSARAHEYGLVWYGGGWLYWFRAGQPLAVEAFPPRFLLEVGRRASGTPESKWR